MSIKLFESNETSFITDGIEDLSDIVISSYTSWVVNSKWPIEAKFKKDFLKSEEIVEGRLLQVPTEKGLQLFRIKNVNKQNKKYVIATGHAEGFEFENNFILDTNIVEKSGRAAMKQIQAATASKSRFTLSSDIDVIATSRMVEKNGITALIGSDNNCFINRWGGYLVLDNFNIAMNKKVGEDRGVEILVGKNLTDFNASISDSDVCTGIYAMSYDGITLPEGVYYSPLVDKYNEPKIQKIKFDTIKYKYSENNYDKEGYETLEEVYEALREACDELFNTEDIDKPKVSAKIEFIDVTKTDQFKGDELGERIFQGDIVTANLTQYGFNMKLKMVKNKYNNVKDRYEYITLGNIKESKFSSINKLESLLDKVSQQLGGNTWQDILDKSMQEAADLIAAGIKDSYVVARKNEILIMDAPQVESSINIIRMNKNGIAFSQNGYNGPYTLAITIDGKINASCITTGELNAALIKTGFLMSANNKTWINMDDGTFNFADKIKFDGGEFTIEPTAITATISNTINDGSGSIETTQFIMDINGFTINNGAFKIRNKKGTTVLQGDSNGNLKLSIFDSVFEMSATGERKTTMTCDVLDKFHLKVPYENQGAGFLLETDTGLKLIEATAGTDYLSIPTYTKISSLTVNNAASVSDFSIKKTRMTHDSNGKFTMNIPFDLKNEGFLLKTSRNTNLIEITAGGNGALNIPIWTVISELSVSNEAYVAGNFSVSGSKNCLHKTEHYGDRLINAYETAEYYFGDLGFGTINGNGECLINIDDIFAECINTDVKYHVFTQAYNGSIKSIERHSTYFIVKGVPDTEFSWELKAKRKGYENVRLDVQDISTVGNLEVKTVENTLLDILDFKLEDILLMEE